MATPRRLLTRLLLPRRGPHHHRRRRPSRRLRRAQRSGDLPRVARRAPSASATSTPTSRTRARGSTTRWDPSEAVTVADDSTALIDDPPHRLQLEVHVGPVTGLVDFRLHPTGEGTEVVFRESRHRDGSASRCPCCAASIHARNKASLERLKRALRPAA